MDIDKAQVAIEAFEIDYGANCPKAVAKIVDHADVLLEFYRYPAERWIHLRTTNPIECTFATVRFAHQDHQGPRSHAAGLAIACSRCWRLSSLKDQWYEPGLRASSVRSLTRPL
jgi:putative transposase